jgi:hypothetical protein
VILTHVNKNVQNKNFLTRPSVMKLFTALIVYCW